MRIIKENQVHHIIEVLEKEVCPLWRTAGNRNSSKVREKLESLGFELINLGTADAQYTCSGMLKIHNISKKNTWCLPGNYLVWGALNLQRGGYPLYRGYAVKVE